MSFTKKEINILTDTKILLLIPVSCVNCMAELYILPPRTLLQWHVTEAYLQMAMYKENLFLQIAELFDAEITLIRQCLPFKTVRIVPLHLATTISGTAYTYKLLQII